LADLKQLTDLYSQDPASERSDASQRRLLCDFLGAVIIVAQARMQNDPSVKVIQNKYLYYIETNL